jgi:hypothetical protein
MFKKLFMMIVLLAVTAATVLFGEGFKLPFFDSTPTTNIVETTTIAPTQTVEYTATAIFTETEQPTATNEITNTPEATATPEVTETAMATETMAPTSTLMPTATLTNTPTSTATVTPTTEVLSDLFSIQTGSPVFMTNFVHTTEGCAWQGVAGQVFNSNGLPLINYILKITGNYNGTSVNQIGLTGAVTNTPYGPGSYEFILGNTPIDSQDQLTVQLFNPDGQEVTSPLSINTSSSCSQNLEIINFQQK